MEGDRGEEGDLLYIGVDVDAVAGWLGSYGGEDSPSDIPAGSSPARSAVPRLLKLFDVRAATTWFIPGHSIETFPEQMQMVADAGHEIGAARLLAREPGGDDPGAGRGGADEVASS